MVAVDVFIFKTKNATYFQNYDVLRFEKSITIRIILEDIRINVYNGQVIWTVLS